MTFDAFSTIVVSAAIGALFGAGISHWLQIVRDRRNFDSAIEANKRDKALESYSAWQHSVRTIVSLGESIRYNDKMLTEVPNWIPQERQADGTQWSRERKRQRIELAGQFVALRCFDSDPDRIETASDLTERAQNDDADLEALSLDLDQFMDRVIKTIWRDGPGV